jgi:hypothetical protein
MGIAQQCSDMPAHIELTRVDDAYYITSMSNEFRKFMSEWNVGIDTARPVIIANTKFF